MYIINLCIIITRAAGTSWNLRSSYILPWGFKQKETFIYIYIYNLSFSWKPAEL